MPPEFAPSTLSPGAPGVLPLAPRHSPRTKLFFVLGAVVILVLIMLGAWFGYRYYEHKKLIEEQQTLIHILDSAPENPATANLTVGDKVRIMQKQQAAGQ